MREDHMEALEKMYPDGYVLIYTCPDTQIRLSYFNPNYYTQLFDYFDLIKENFFNPEDEIE